MLIYPKDAAEVSALLSWCEDILGEELHYDNPYTVAVVNSKTHQIESVIIYYWYDGSNIFISTAINTKRLYSYHIINQVLKIPFNRPFNCNRISALVAETNMRSRRLVERFGFQQEGVMRDHPIAGKQMLLYGLTLQDFTEGPYGLSWRKRKIFA